MQTYIVDSWAENMCALDIMGRKYLGQIYLNTELYLGRNYLGRNYLGPKLPGPKLPFWAEITWAEITVGRNYLAPPYLSKIMECVQTWEKSIEPENLIRVILDSLYINNNPEFEELT